MEKSLQVMKMPRDKDDEMRMIMMKKKPTKRGAWSTVMMITRLKVIFAEGTLKLANPPLILACQLFRLWG